MPYRRCHQHCSQHFFWPNDNGGQHAAAPSHTVPQDLGWQENRHEGAACWSTRSIPVPSYQGTDNVGTSSCMHLSQSKVSQRFLGLQ